jgi:hypothetical protein
MEEDAVDGDAGGMEAVATSTVVAVDTAVVFVDVAAAAVVLVVVAGIRSLGSAAHEAASWPTGAMSPQSSGTSKSASRLRAPAALVTAAAVSVGFTLLSSFDRAEDDVECAGADAGAGEGGGM